MMTQTLERTIHFCHAPSEVSELEKAIIPMQEFVARCSSGPERNAMHKILGARYFRRSEVLTMHRMLTRSIKFSKSHLDEYFPSMRQEVLVNAKLLEDALARYYESFLEWEAATPLSH